MNKEERKGGQRMPDKNDDLIFDTDLTSDFLESEESSEAAAKSGDPVGDIPVPSDLQDPSGTQVDTPKNVIDKKPNIPNHQGDLSSDTQDWIEDAKVDLPGQLALDIYETKLELIVLCRIAGVDEKNIDVSISADDILSIRGTLMIPKIETSVDNYFIQECYWGEFSRSVSLPVDVKKDNIDATLENGILIIKFVKIKRDSIKKINIKTNNQNSAQ